MALMLRQRTGTLFIPNDCSKSSCLASLVHSHLTPKPIKTLSDYSLHSSYTHSKMLTFERLLFNFYHLTTHLTWRSPWQSVFLRSWLINILTYDHPVIYNFSAQLRWSVTTIRKWSQKGNKKFFRKWIRSTNYVVRKSLFKNGNVVVIIRTATSLNTGPLVRSPESTIAHATKYSFGASVTLSYMYTVCNGIT